MNEALERLNKVASRVAEASEDVGLARIDDQARLHLALVVQRSLEDRIGNAGLEAIAASGVAESTGLQPAELYAVAHADRRTPVTITQLYRLATALGFDISLTSATVHA